MASREDGPHWRWRLLAASQLFGGFLLASWFFEPTRDYWNSLDLAVFRFTDASLAWGEPWRVFWAALNSRTFDLFAAGFFLVIYMAFVVRAPRADAARNLAAGISIAVYTSTIIWLSSHYVFTFERLSPTWVVDGARRLSELVAWIPHKDWSGKSFPGDHGIAAIMFTSLLWLVAGARYGAVSMAVSVFFVLPRLFSGAHWLSDVAAGSVGVSAIALGILVATPLWSGIRALFRYPVDWLLGVAQRVGLIPSRLGEPD